MYYGNDSNGDIIFGEDSSVLPEEFQEVFPEYPPQADPVTSDQFDGLMSYVSGGNLVDDITGSVVEALEIPEPLSGDELYDLLALIPGYNVFPSTAAVSVFDKVLNGLDGKFKYLILSGSDSNYTYLYYGFDVSVSGATITFNAPYTICTYYQYRPNTNSAWQYYYTVEHKNAGSDYFNITNQLVYTNVVEGYPDLVPYKSRETFSISIIISICALLLALYSVGTRIAKGAKKK